MFYLHRACEDTRPMKMGRLFQKVGTQNSDTREVSKSKNTIFKTGRKIEIKEMFVGTFRLFKMFKMAMLSITATEKKISNGVCCVPLL